MSVIGWFRGLGRPSLGITIAAPLCAIAFAISFSLYLLNHPTGYAPKTVRIEQGATLSSIATRLEKERIIRSAWFLKLVASFTGSSRKITAGDHPFSGRMTAWEVLEELQIPRDVTRSVTIPEGLRKERVVDILAKTLELNHDTLLILVEDSVFCRELGVEAMDLEGYLFPETYRVSVTTTERQIVRILVDHFHKAFGTELKAAAMALDMSVHEAVTMASIIEGEAQVGDERSTISAVYHNRLRKRMRLQADPTVQYAIPDGPRRLFYKDYEYPSRYNTYRHGGLPPGPILSPGAASLHAAVHPEDVGYLYFVAKGDGSHVFSRTAAEHEAAKRATKSARRKTWKKNRR